jgi:hypothetical protein
MAVGTAGADGRLQPIFPRGSPLPSQARRILTTSDDDQDTIVVGIHQGDAEAAVENEFLGAFVFSGLARGPRGSVRIEARFRIDAEGVLAVSGVDLERGCAVTCARAAATTLPIPGGARSEGLVEAALARGPAPAATPLGPREGRSFEGAPPRIEARLPAPREAASAWGRVKGWFGSQGGR